MSERRRPNLDGLRAIAVMMVLLHHSSNSTSESFFLQPVLLTGWNGIFLFFILSGFLIGSILIREVQTDSTLSLKNFWGRRIFRTWPVYFIVLAFQWWRNTPSFDAAWPYLVFGQNISNRPFFFQSWSLAVQEQFYLVLPILILLLSFRFQVEAKAFLLSFVALFAAGVVGVLNQGHILLFGALMPLMTGVLIAQAERTKNPLLAKIKQSPNLAMGLGVLFVYIPFFFLGEGVTLYFYETLGFSLIIMACLAESNFLSPVLNSAVAIFAAQVSYSTYLFQDRPLMRVARTADQLSLTGVARDSFVLVGSVIAAFLCGAVLFYLFERPFMNLRSRLFPSKVR